MTRPAALVAVIVSSMSFATLAVLARLAYDAGAEPLPLLAWRFAVAAALMGVFLLFRHPGALREGARDIRSYALLSLTGYGAASIAFFFALTHASASVVAIILYTYPAMVSAAALVFRREHPSVVRLLALALTFGGCGVVALSAADGTATEPLGVALALVAAVGYAAFTMLSEPLMHRQRRLVVMTYTFGMSAVLAGLVTVASGGSLSPTGWAPAIWILLGAIVVLPTLVAVFLYLQGIRGLGAAQAAIASTAEPAFTVVLAVVFLAERPGGWYALGALLIVAGILVDAWWGSSTDAGRLTSSPVP